MYLEQQGKIPAPECSTYSTGQGQQSEEFAQTQEAYEKDCKKKSSGDFWGKLLKWCGKVLKKGCDTSFEVTRNGKQMMTIPVLILVLGCCFAFWVTVPLLVVGMFLGCSYRFIGFESTSIDINDMCQKASETCENIKNDFHGNKE